MMLRYTFQSNNGTDRELVCLERIADAKETTVRQVVTETAVHSSVKQKSFESAFVLSVRRR